jgi:hypothetical protein
LTCCTAKDVLVPVPCLPAWYFSHLPWGTWYFSNLSRGTCRIPLIYPGHLIFL